VIGDQLSAVMAERQQLTREMHERLSKQLAVLNTREDRLIDLAADGSLSKAKIQQRINTLRLERKRVEEALADTGEELAIGARRLIECLNLISNPSKLYAESSDRTRRQLNQTFYKHFYIDEVETIHVHASVLRSPFDEIREAYDRLESSDLATNNRDPVRGDEVSDDVTASLADVFSVAVSSKTDVVGATGIEPVTPRL
jgi:site-specific DNA recombinase